MIRSIGIDTANSQRFAKLLAKDRGLLLRLMLNPTERNAFADQPAIAATKEASYFAGRWAAKEAVLKALGTGIGPVSLHEISVFRRDSGEPYIELSGRAVDHGRQRHIDRLHLSITHEGGIATALVIAEGDV